MKITRTLTGPLLSCGVLFAFSLHAQPAAPLATQQAQNFQKTMEQQQPLLSLKPGTNAPEIYQGENADVGPQHVLRLLQPRTYFMVRVDSQYLYSDNVLLTQNPKSPGTEWVNTVQAGFEPGSYKMGSGRFTPSVGYVSQWFNYGLGGPSTGGGGPLDVIDFNVQKAFVSAKYQFPRNWTLYGEFDYSRFLSQQNYQEFYHEFVPIVGAQRLIQIGDNALFAVTFESDYHASWAANPPHNSQDRADGIFGLSFAYQFARHFVVEPYYRFQYTYYRFDTAHTEPNPKSRNDYLNSCGVSASYYLTHNLSLRAFFNYNINNSDDSMAQEYHEYNVGADLAWGFKF